MVVVMSHLDFGGEKEPFELEMGGLFVEWRDLFAWGLRPVQNSLSDFGPFGFIIRYFFKLLFSLYA